MMRTYDGSNYGVRAIRAGEQGVTLSLTNNAAEDLAGALDRLNQTMLGMPEAADEVRRAIRSLLRELPPSAPPVSLSPEAAEYRKRLACQRLDPAFAGPAEESFPIRPSAEAHESHPGWEFFWTGGSRGE